MGWCGLGMSWRQWSAHTAAARRSGSTATAGSWWRDPSRARMDWHWDTEASMTEPCDLTAIEARRLIGQKKLAPTELLESCIARIEAVDHAVNAMVARDFDRARKTAKVADAAVAR